MKNIILSAKSSVLIGLFCIFAVANDYLINYGHASWFGIMHSGLCGDVDRQRAMQHRARDVGHSFARVPDARTQSEC